MVHYLPKRMLRSFKHWTIQDLDATFGLQKAKGFAPLKRWLAAEYPITETSLKQLGSLSELAGEYVDFWNEEELKMHFVAPLLAEVRFNREVCTIFYDRPLSSEVEGKEMGGKVDMLIATGYQKPIEPFFFLHEYKPTNKTSTDPLGQLMAAMITAQGENTDKQMPLYGCYIIGRHWYFVALSAKKYGISPAYDVTKPSELEHIFNMLGYIKETVEQYVKPNRIK